MPGNGARAEKADERNAHRPFPLTDVRRENCADAQKLVRLNRSPSELLSLPPSFAAEESPPADGAFLLL